jgi:hypothetical protein
VGDKRHEDAVRAERAGQVSGAAPQRRLNTNCDQAAGLIDSTDRQGIASAIVKDVARKVLAREAQTPSWLGRLFGTRGWRRWALAGLIVALVGWGATYRTEALVADAQPKTLETLRAAVVEIAASNDARRMATELWNVGNRALNEGNSETADQALEALTDLRTTLEQEYTLRIVNRPGEYTGLWRTPSANAAARNYYLLVEAIDASGKALTVPIRNEETGKTDRVKIWGLRVDEATYDAFGMDKKNDGVLERQQFGYKRRGHLAANYDIPTTGGSITKW